MNPEPWVFPVVAGPEGSQVWLARRMPTGSHHSPPHHPRGGCPAHILHTQTCMIHKRPVTSVDFTYFLGHFVRLQLRKMWHRASNTLLYGSRHFPVAKSHVQVQRTAFFRSAQPCQKPTRANVAMPPAEQEWYLTPLGVPMGWRVLSAYRQSLCLCPNAPSVTHLLLGV